LIEGLQNLGRELECQTGNQSEGVTREAAHEMAWRG
jgi:hypothetical protein